MFAYRYSLLAISFLYCDERSDEVISLVTAAIFVIARSAATKQSPIVKINKCHSEARSAEATPLLASSLLHF